MQPKRVQMTAHKTMELNGLRCLVLIWAKKGEKGVALSRAKVQNTRLAVRKQPMVAATHGMRERMSKPKEPPAEPVDCRYISVRGKRKLEERMASRSLML